MALSPGEVRRSDRMTTDRLGATTTSATIVGRPSVSDASPALSSRVTRTRTGPDSCWPPAPEEMRRSTSTSAMPTPGMATPGTTVRVEIRNVLVAGVAIRLIVPLRRSLRKRKPLVVTWPLATRNAPSMRTLVRKGVTEALRPVTRVALAASGMVNGDAARLTMPAARRSLMTVAPQPRLAAVRR